MLGDRVAVTGGVVLVAEVAAHENVRMYRVTSDGLSSDGLSMPKVHHQSKADQVSDILRTMILTGEIAPGWRMTQDQLAGVLGVSITPVREALLRLSTLGLIEATRGRSFRVAETTPDDVRDVFWEHASLAAELTRRSCARRSDELVTALRACRHAYEQAVRADDLDAMTTAEWEFHRTIYRAAGSPRLLFMLRTTLGFIPHGLFSQIEGWGERSVAAHTMITSAIEAGYGDSAAHAASGHIREAGELLVELLEARGYWGEPAEQAVEVGDHSEQPRTRTTSLGT